MEGQIESQVNPKRKKKKKGKGEKEEIRMLLTMACIGVEIKGKRKQGRKTFLKGEGLGSAAAHRPRPAKNQSGWEDSFLRNNKYVSAKVEKMSEEVLKTKKPKRIEKPVGNPRIHQV